MVDHFPAPVTLVRATVRRFHCRTDAAIFYGTNVAVDGANRKNWAGIFVEVYPNGRKAGPMCGLGVIDWRRSLKREKPEIK